MPGHLPDVAHLGDVSRLPVAHQFRQAAGVGADHGDTAAHGLQGRQAEALLFAGQQIQVGTGQDPVHPLLFSQEHHAVLQAQFPGQLLHGDALRSFPHQQQLALDPAPHLGVHADDVPDALDRPEIRDVGDDLLVVLDEFADVAVAVPPAEPVYVDEIGDHPDVLVHVEQGQRIALQGLGHRRDALALLDAEPGDPVEGLVAPHEGDIGAVEGRDDLDVPVAQHVPRQEGAGGVGNGVVHVQDVQFRLGGHIGHLRREREGVRRILEQRIGHHLHVVEGDVLVVFLQAEGDRIAHEMDHVPLPGQRLSQFGGDGAASSVGGIAGDADVHFAPAKWARGSSIERYSRTTKGSPYRAPISAP